MAGSVNVQTLTFTGRLDMRIIDVETGEVVAAANEEGTHKIRGVKVAGTGTDYIYDETLVSQVFEPVVRAMTPKLVNRIVDAAN